MNAFLESVLAQPPAAGSPCSTGARVEVWNDRAEDLWGVRADEVRGQHLLDLDIGLPVESCAEPIRTA